MHHDRSTLPPHLASLFEQIAATEARIAQLDRALAAIRSGRLLDLDPPHRSVPDGDAVRDTENPSVDTPAVAVADEALVARPTPQRGVRPFRRPGRPAKKQHHSHQRGH